MSRKRDRSAAKKVVQSHVAAGTFKPKPPVARARLFLRSKRSAEILEHVTATSRVRFDRASITLESSSFEGLEHNATSAQPARKDEQAQKEEPRCSGQGCAAFHTDKNDEERT